MKIKFNWGTGIFIAIVLMVSAMGVLVYIAVSQDYYLVEDDYYQKAVNYQEHINKEINTNQLAEKIIFSESDEGLKISWPEQAKGETVSGKILLYHAENSGFDSKLDVKMDADLQQLISTSSLHKGRYTVKIDWSMNDKAYYQEHQFSVE